jgi:hypothetical protein
MRLKSWASSKTGQAHFFMKLFFVNTKNVVPFNLDTSDSRSKFNQAKLNLSLKALCSAKSDAKNQKEIMAI